MILKHWMIKVYNIEKGLQYIIQRQIWRYTYKIYNIEILLDANVHFGLSEKNECLITGTEAGKIRFHKRTGDSKYTEDYIEIKAHRGR